MIKQQKGDIRLAPGEFSGAVSLRKFKVEGYGSCVLSLLQKDKKYYRNNGYEYAWMRMIIAVKDLDGFRYIDGSYSNEKVLSVRCALNPGEYYAIIMGDWKKRVLDVTLNYQGNVEVELTRESLSIHPKILEETCKDMAQRFGKFKQLTKSICSYQYKDYRSKLMIENFINESQREVNLHRGYSMSVLNYYIYGNSCGNTSHKLENGKEIKTTLDREGEKTFIGVFVGEVSDEDWEGADFNRY